MGFPMIILSDWEMRSNTCFQYWEAREMQANFVLRGISLILLYKLLTQQKMNGFLIRHAVLQVF